MSEVIALMGKVYTVPGNWAMVSQTSIKIAPLSATAGINTK